MHNGDNKEIQGVDEMITYSCGSNTTFMKHLNGKKHLVLLKS